MKTRRRRDFWMTFSKVSGKTQRVLATVIRLHLAPAHHVAAQACLQPLARPRLRQIHSLVYSVKPGAVVIPLPVLVQERKGEETHQ